MEATKLAQHPATEAPAETEGEVFDPAAHRPDGKSLRKVGLVVAAILIALLIAGIVPRMARHAEMKADARKAADALARVQVARVERSAPGAALVLPASVQPLQETAIYARANGYVKRWTVDIGAKVKRGDILAELDVPDVDAELQQAEAVALQSQAGIAQAKTQLGLTGIINKRATALGPQGVVSQQEVDQAQAADDAQRSGVAAAEAAFRSSRANVKRLAEQQNFRLLVAPFDGVVTQRTAEVGQLVTAGTAAGAPLFRVAEVDVVRVFVNVPQLYASGIQVGMDAPTVVREMPGRTFTGKVARTARELDSSTRSLLTEVDIPNPDNALFAGMYAKISFDVKHLDPLLLVPATAVLFDAQGTRAAVVADGTLSWRKVEIDSDYGDRLAIGSGLKEGELVAVLPIDSFADGMRVEPDEQKPKPPEPPAVAPTPSSAATR